MNSSLPGDPAGASPVVRTGRAPLSFFAWGVGGRLALAMVLVVALWLVVAVALDWLGVPG
ncbi:MAG: hypothetical protein H7837_10820 [Magnetococcus sp. MYC-9]